MNTEIIGQSATPTKLAALLAAIRLFASIVGRKYEGEMMGVLSTARIVWILCADDVRRGRWF